MTLTEHLNDLHKTFDSTWDDATKAEKGNKSARTRLRKSMSEIKAKAQAIRVAVLDQRDADA